jgi:hypothetical protein
MSDAEDVFKAIEEWRPCAPQIRIYLLSEVGPPITSLSAALPDYETILPHSKTEVAFIRKMAVESEQEYKGEVERVAAIMAPLLVADSYLSCVYDDSEGRTQFLMEMRKTGGMPKFIEMDPASDPGR